MTSATEGTNKLTNIMGELIDNRLSYDESQEIYKKWAKETSHSYDALHHDKKHYNAPDKLRDKMVELFPHPEKVLVLDVGAGTGIIGEWLFKVGFKNLHALEPLDEFASVSAEKGIYHKILSECIGGGSVVSSPDNSYDAIVTSGTFAPAHIPCDALYEVIRLIKPGGYFVNCMRNSYLCEVDMYVDKLEPLIRQLEAEGKWKQVTWEVYPRHFMDHEGLLMVFQVC